MRPFTADLFPRAGPFGLEDAAHEGHVDDYFHDRECSDSRAHFDHPEAVALFAGGEEQAMVRLVQHDRARARM